MKVALVNKYWFLKGGTEHVLFLTRDALLSAGHEVVCFGMEHPDNSVSLSHPVSYIDIKSPKWYQLGRIIYNVQAKKMFIKFLETEKPDIIHFHNIYHQLSFSLLDAARTCGIPTVMTLHDYQLFSPNYMLFLDGRPYYRTLGGSFYRCIGDRCMGTVRKSVVATIEGYVRLFWRKRFQPDHLIAPSMYMHSTALQCGYTSREVTFLPNPIPSIEKSVVQARKKSTYAVFVGRFVEEKGIKVLLDAWRQLPDIPLVLVGDGPCMPWVIAYVRDNNMTQVQLRGWCDSQTTQQILADATCSIFPSQWPENCPMAVLSSLQLCVLPIGSSIGGMAELLDPQFSFPYHQPDDMVGIVRRVWSMSTKERGEKCKNIQKKVLPRHALDRYTKNLLALYTSICNGHS